MTLYIEYGLWSLFFASFLAATVFPFSSEALLAFLIASDYNLYSCLIVATAGNWLGGMSGYYLGYAGKWVWIERWLKIKPEKIKMIKTNLDKYGSFMAFFTWLPFIGDVLAVGLGLIRSNVIYVSLFMLAGKFLRYVALAYFADWGVKQIL